MKILTDLLRRKEPTAADLRAALDGLDIPAKAAAVSEVRARRRAMLLDGEAGPALDKVERELTNAVREHDRAVALDEELRERLGLAEQREALDALAARKAAAETESKAVADMVDRHVPEMIAFLRDLSARRMALTAECMAVNGELEAIGSTERIEQTTPKIREPGPFEIAALTGGPQLNGYETVAR